MKILILLASVMMLSACSGSSDNSDIFYPDPYLGPEENLKKTTFGCEIEGGCPENIGMIYSRPYAYDYSGLGMCSGFLVADDIVATNSHCVPKFIRDNPYRCSGNLAIRFKKNGGDIVRDCKSLVRYNNYEGALMDYAFFRVESTGIQPIQISKEGVTDGEMLTSINMSPYGSRGFGALRKKMCKTTFHSVLGGGATNRWAERALAMECQLIKGNSGSPLLKENGQAIGISQAVSTTEGYDRGLYSNPVYNFESKAYIPALYFTNFACINDPITNKRNPACDIVADAGFMMCQNDKMTEAEAKLQEWIDQLPKEVHFKIKHNGKDSYYFAEPVCAYKDKFEAMQGDSFSHTYQALFEYSISIPLDAYGRANDQIDVVVKNRIDVEMKAEYRSWGKMWININSKYNYGSYSLRNEIEESTYIEFCDFPSGTKMGREYTMDGYDYKPEDTDEEHAEQEAYCS